MKRTLRAFLTLGSLSYVTACTDMHDQPETSTEALTITSGQVAQFELTQPWQDQQEAAFREGSIELSWTPAALIVNAQLTDDVVYTGSDADNQHMWELGDVFEVFLQIEGQEDYIELHITPANTRFHAHKPNPIGTDPATGEWKPIEHWLVTPIGFEAQANQVKGGWLTSMQIPPSTLGLDAFTPGTALRISFGRYDGAPEGEPILSTSAPHQIVSFHIPEDWHRIVLQK